MQRGPSIRTAAWVALACSGCFAGAGARVGYRYFPGESRGGVYGGAVFEQRVLTGKDMFGQELAFALAREPFATMLVQLGGPAGGLVGHPGNDSAALLGLGLEFGSERPIQAHVSLCAGVYGERYAAACGRASSGGWGGVDVTAGVAIIPPWP